MRHIPSLKTLRDYFNRYLEHDYGDQAEQKLQQLRRALVAWRDGRIKSRVTLDIANRILDGHGIEYIESENRRARGYYVNMGDTYNSTLLLDIPKDRVWATTWGDWVEAEERKGNRFT